MKILILSDDFPPRVSGGPAVVAADLARAYKQEGHSVTIITTVRKEAEAGRYEHEGMTVHAIHSDYHQRWHSWRSLYNPPMIAKLRALIKNIGPDAVHAHNIHYHLSYHSLKLSKQAKAKVVLTTHDCMLFHYGKFTQFIDKKDMSIEVKGDLHISQLTLLRTYRWWYNPFRQLAIRYYLGFCDHLCAVSHKLKEALEANGIKGAEVVYNGIDTSLWRPTPTDMITADSLKFKNNFNIASQAKIVSFVGRLSDLKGGDQLVKAFVDILKKVPEAVLLAIGRRDQYGEKIVSEAKKLGIGEFDGEGRKRLVFTGWIYGQDLRHAYEASDVVAFPSICFDTFGMVNIEAMAMEKPVVATCFGGAPEVVEDKVTGAIVNPLNVGMLSEAIIDLLTDGEKARRFGRAGREMVERKFTLKSSVEQYIKFLSRAEK